MIIEREQLLADEQAALTMQQKRLVASVALIQALDGGWNTPELSGRNIVVASAVPM